MNDHSTALDSDAAESSVGSKWWTIVAVAIANDPEELYDLEADPNELTNLARSPACRKTLA